MHEQKVLSNFLINKMKALAIKLNNWIKLLAKLGLRQIIKVSNFRNFGL